jgi:hypothetical protein
MERGEIPEYTPYEDGEREGEISIISSLGHPSAQRI